MFKICDSFIESLIDTLDCHRELLQAGTTEYALIRFLQRKDVGLLEIDCLQQSHSMFAVHFLLFHCLYQLKRRYLREGIGELTIHTLNIRLNISKSIKKKADEKASYTCEIEEVESLANYYLELKNINVSEQDVEDMLNGFWHRFVSEDFHSGADIKHACELLGIEELEPLSKAKLKHKYKQVLIEVHPDKGGSKRKAQEVIQAYRLLSRSF